VDSPYLLRVGTLWRCGDGLFFEVSPLASGALLTTLHPLVENVLQTVCCKLQEDSGTGGFDLGAPFSWLEKPGNCMERDLNCMAVRPISASSSIATSKSRNADAPLRLLRRPRKGSFKTTATHFSRSRLSVVRSASLAKEGTPKKRPSSHLHKVPTRSNKVSPRTFQMALVYECSNTKRRVYREYSKKKGILRLKRK
jgi:hypothetical protein